VIEYEEVVKVVRIPLKVKSHHKGHIPSAFRSRAIRTLSEFDNRDKIRVETQDAKNSLEELVYSSKEKLYDDDFVAASTQEEREKLSEELSTTSTWLEEDGSNAKLRDYKSKKEALMKSIYNIVLRIREAYQRPEIAQYCTRTFNTTRSLLTNITQKLEVKEEEVAEVLLECDSTEKWLAEKSDEQAKLEAWQDPVFLSEHAEKKCRDLYTKASKLIKRPRKKPPKPAPNATNTTNETTSEKQANNDSNKEQELPNENSEKERENSDNSQNTKSEHNTQPEQGTEAPKEEDKPDL